MAVARARKPFSDGQLVTVFRSRLREEAEPAYRRTAEEMLAAARRVPGFVDFKTFTADDGERVSLVTFATPEAHQVWRNDPRHRRAMEAGREQFYREYSIQVGECTYVSAWNRNGH